MQFTYRNPDRSTDPDRILPGARSLVVGAWGYRRDEPRAGPPGTGGAPGGRAVARYARRDHYASLRGALAPVAERLRPRRLAGRAWCATTTPWSTGPPPTGPDSAGSGRTPCCCCPGLGSWFVLGSVVTDAPLTAPTADRTPPAAARERVRPLHAVPDGLPDRRPGGARGSSTPGGAWPGWCRPRAPSPRSTARPSATASTAATSASRPAPSTGWPTAGTRRRRPRGRQPARGRPPGPAGRLRRRAAGRPTAAGTSPAASPGYLRRNALVALGNTATGADPATEQPPCGGALADRRRRCWSSTPRWAARRLGRHDLVDRAGVTHLLVTNDFPPKVGRHPGLPVGAVAPARPGLLRGAHRLVPPRRRRPSTPSRPSGGPDRAGAAPRSCCPRPAWSGGSGRRPAGSAPTWWSSTRPSRSG